MTKKNQDAWLYEGGRITRRQLLALAAATGMSVMYNGKALAQQPAAATAPPAAPKGQVVVGLSQESTVFNPLLSSIEVDHGVWWNLYDPLWNCDETGQLHPKLATEIPSVENGGVSEDGLNWRIRLRDDVVWHDGTPFTAEDVKFTLELINNPDFNSRTRQGHELVKNIQVVGPHELTWEMDRLYAPYWSQLSSTFMVPAHILGKADDPNTAPFNQQPVGTGPFKWGSRTSGDRLVLEANTDYFGDGPYIERLVFKYIPDMNALYTQFRTGQVDMVGINGILNNFYEEASQLPDLVIDVNQTASIESITPNHEHPALKHKEVRQALYQGINKQAIIDLIYYGLPAPTESFLPNESWAYNADLPKQVYDLDAANAILDEAGWVRGSGGIREKDGVKLAFDLSTTSGSELRAQTQQLIQQDWLKLGVDMKINNMPAAVMWGISGLNQSSKAPW
ncbi:peptide ABC transporter substrate-binding protein [Paenalcaligenes niemegkensis]|uniref:peptide ABC transporter substrate-binding protein n=1 Tax=Paenalcaligenes niemegkensis TaxID=2895469 RepID=UPI001EE80B12|nr:peptide ABC transporter substrate-binding protein [Paenalcaligenes niemegkensis]MCQ9615610.1 peptide ABC transporter substrate-binding protein [Paenalcaligenes niemegkensis]